ncbi:MAG: ATP-dependent helicase HrpB [Deltaproteobacteria bacterium]|nr:ATP-dependent helicase HrpB [Deltaproteobacteria bacterium]
MSEPVTGGAAKAASEMMKELQQAMQQAEQLGQVDGAKGGGQFQNVLQSQQVGGVQGPQGVQGVGGVQGQAGVQSPGSIDVLRGALSAQRAPAVPAVGRTLDRGSAISGGLHKMMGEVMGGQNKLEKIMQLAMSGRNFSSSELLALQAGVYRFTQELELTSKVIEKGTSAVKQTLNTQV